MTPKQVITIETCRRQ